MKLTEEQQLIVDRMVSVHNESGACYGRMVYKQSVYDCVEL